MENKFVVSTTVGKYNTFDDAVAGAKRQLGGSYARDLYYIAEIQASVGKPLPEAIVTKF